MLKVFQFIQGRLIRKYLARSYPNIFYEIFLFPFAQIFLGNSINEVDSAWTTNNTVLQPYEGLKPAGY